LLSADDVGTNAIMAATGTSRTCVWCWQERFLTDEVEGLLRDTETRARHRFERRVEGDRKSVV